MIVMGTIASRDDESAVLRGVVTFVLRTRSMLVVPVPFARMLIAGVAAFLRMLGWKIVAKR